MAKVLLGNETSNHINGVIAYYEAVRHSTRSETIRRSGMSPANFYKAWKDPSLFRIGQLIRIYDFLNVPDQERRFT